GVIPLRTLPAPHTVRDLWFWRCPLMSTRRGQPGSSQGVSCAPLTPTVPSPSPGERGQTSGCIPRQAISIILPQPPGLPWRMLGVGAAFGLLLITGLSLAALAL